MKQNIPSGMSNKNAKGDFSRRGIIIVIKPGITSAQTMPVMGLCTWVG